LQTAYSNEPTELQQSSYSIHLINLVREENVYDFERIICAGLSANPCNQYGESLVHMVCRRGAAAFLKVLLENGCDVQVSDDMGRTPAHDACWAAKPYFGVVRMILEKDPFMFQLTDCRGATPLAYVPRKDWAAWLQFLEYVKDDFWPQRDVKRDGEQQPPILTLQPPNSRPVPDPTNALSPSVAALVSSGVLDPRSAPLHKGHSSSDSETVCSSDAEAGDEGEGEDDDDDDEDSSSSSSSYLSDDDIDEADKEEE
jgi:ankyrin repeat protein